MTHPVLSMMVLGGDISYVVVIACREMSRTGAYYMRSGKSSYQEQEAVPSHAAMTCIDLHACTIKTYERTGLGAV